MTPPPVRLPWHRAGPPRPAARHNGRTLPAGRRRAPLRPLDLAPPVTLYALASRARARWLSAVGLGALLVGAYLCGLVEQTQLRQPAPVDGPLKPVPPVPAPDLLLASFSAVFPVLAILVAVFPLGDAVRSRRAHLRTLEDWAADLERDRLQREALAAAAERGRLTREMHDVVARGLSVIVMQAQGGAAVLRAVPDRAAEAPENIVVTGRAAMADMRSLLGLAHAGPPWARQPGVADLPALVDRIRAAGTPVVLDIGGQPPPLPTAIDLSAYRIAQEALTNVINHAGGGARATVRIAFQPDRLELEISDDGGGPHDPDGPGAVQGLRGIAERVAAFGGELCSGPAASGGFRVHALLPTHPVTEPV